MSAASFRPATESDVSVLLELMHALYEEDGSAPLRLMTKRLNAGQEQR